MKKIATLLLLIIFSTFLFGCGKKDATINRLSKSLETVTQTSEQLLEKIEELKEENLNLMITIDELKAQLAEQDVTISETEAKSSQNTITYIVNSGSSDSYLSIKFWSDGKTYVGSSVVTWYSDYYCSKQITSDVIIISPVIDSLRLSNGNTIYACMSSNGLVFTPKNPYLIVKN